MPTPTKALAKLRTICLNWSKDLEPLPSQSSRMSYFESALPEILLDNGLIRLLLDDITQGRIFPSQPQKMMFDNEVLLYMDARRRFSLRMYLHAPGEYTAIHDHSAWGVLGNASGTMEIIKYRRLDDGSREGTARIEESQRITRRPGQTDTTLPLNDGIHCVGNPTDQSIAIINVYGSPIRRLFINRFDPDNHRVFKLFPPRLRKKRLAARVLEEFDTENSKRES